MATRPEPKMRDLARLLHPIKSQWRAIGVQLAVPNYELYSIERDQSLDDLDKLTKVCQLWKDKRTTEVSWRKILDIIRNLPPIHNEDVCQQIEKLLGIEPAQMSSSMETNQPTGTGESVSMQSSMTETAQEEEKSQPLRQRRINSQDRPVDDINMNQSEVVSPSESSAAVSGSTPSPKTTSTSGAWSKSIIGFLIGFVIGSLTSVILLTCIYLVYTNYYDYKESMSTTDFIFSLKAVGSVIAIILLIVPIAVLFYRNLNKVNESTVLGILVAFLIQFLHYLTTGNSEMLQALVNDTLGKLIK